MSLLQSKLCRIESEDILKLLQELHQITGFSLEECRDQSLFLYLSGCLYNNPRRERSKIKREELDSLDPTDSFLLRRKLKNLCGTDVHRVCDELVRHHNNVFLNESVELFDGTALYVFLNKKLPDYKKGKKRPHYRF